MKKKVLLTTVILALALAVTTGCSKKEEVTKKADTTEKKTEETLKTIGTKSDKAYEIKMTNKTKKDIIAVQVKSSTEEAYPANLMDTSDSYKQDETRLIYYTPATTETTTSDESGKLVTIGYSIQLTFADQSTVELHSFPFGDIEEGDLNLEDTVAYVTYKSVSTKEEVSTLGAEKAVKEQAAAAAKAAEDAAAAAKAAEEAAAAQAAADAAAAANQAATTQETPQTTTETYTAPQTTTETYTEPAADNSGSDNTASDGCVTDGLLN